MWKWFFWGGSPPYWVRAAITSSESSVHQILRISKFAGLAALLTVAESPTTSSIAVFNLMATAAASCLFPTESRIPLLFVIWMALTLMPIDCRSIPFLIRLPLTAYVVPSPDLFTTTPESWREGASWQVSISQWWFRFLLLVNLCFLYLGFFFFTIINISSLLLTPPSSAASSVCTPTVLDDAISIVTSVCTPAVFIGVLAPPNGAEILLSNSSNLSIASIESSAYEWPRSHSLRSMPSFLAASISHVSNCPASFFKAVAQSLTCLWAFLCFHYGRFSARRQIMIKPSNISTWLHRPRAQYESMYM